MIEFIKMFKNIMADLVKSTKIPIFAAEFIPLR